MKAVPYKFPLWLIFATTAILSGCTPSHYRLQADREAYGILRTKAALVNSDLAARELTPPVSSRNYDPAPSDCPPLPPDDPLAHRDMHCPADQPGYQHWHDQGDAASIESPAWQQYVELNEEGYLELTAPRAVELGLLHSRDYQFEVERLYLSALALTFQRFEFDLQWFGGNTTDFRFGGDSQQRKTLTTGSFLGFSRNFASGGQMLVNFANTFVWQFSGKQSGFAPSNLTMNFVQPLLRGAFRDIRLENLTQAERNVLYRVRDFARFRKQFYFDVVSGDQGYLDLLLQLQATRNLEQNLVALEENLKAHEALAEAGIVSPLQVDQVFQSYQGGRLRLIQANNALENALDNYKILLGLPPELPVQLDDSQLEPFELASVKVTTLEKQLNNLLSNFRQLSGLPSADHLRDVYAELQDYLDGVRDEIESIQSEWERWQAMPLNPLQGLEGSSEREAEARLAMGQRLVDLRQEVLRLRGQVTEARTSLNKQRSLEDAQLFERQARQASNHIADLFVVQTQIRAHLIKLTEMNLPDGLALRMALRDRLDLMNQQAAVVDAWRKIRVASDALEADLDVFLNADIATPRGTSNPLDFSSSASSYRVGVQFDSPLNRLAERNIYRAELIDYQRARRDFTTRRDGIARAVRRDLRTIEAERLNFEISRQSLVAAARQVELARLQLLAPDADGDSSATQDALNALNSMLEAKNSLVASWVAYETARLQLLLDTEALQLDGQGQLSAASTFLEEALPVVDYAEPLMGFEPLGAEPRENVIPNAANLPSPLDQ